MRLTMPDGTTIDGTLDECLDFVARSKAPERQTQFYADDGHEPDCPARGASAWFSVVPCCRRVSQYQITYGSAPT